MMEGNRRNKPRALLVFGAPASGKTTFADKFAKKFGLASYDLKTLMDEHGFTYEMIMILVEQILKTGQTVLIEGAIDTEKERTDMRNLARNYGYEPALIWVQTDTATIRQRLKLQYRNVTKAKTAYDKAVAIMEAPTEAERPIILSGKHTFETQTKHVIAGLADL